jgi:hypothetical protein
MSENEFFNRFSNKNKKTISKQENVTKFLGLGTKWGLYGHIILLIIPLEILISNFIIGLFCTLPIIFLILCDIQGLKDEKEKKKTDKIYGLNVSSYDNRFTIQQWCHNMHIMFPIEEKRNLIILSIISFICFLTGILLIGFMDFSLINVFIFFLSGIGLLGLIGLGIYVKKGKYVYPWILEQEKERKKMKENIKLKQTLENNKKYRKQIQDENVKTSKELKMFGLNYDTYNKDNLKKAWLLFVKNNHPDLYEKADKKEKEERTQKFLYYKNVYEELNKQFKS